MKNPIFHLAPACGPLLLLLLCTACQHDNRLFNTPHPTQGALLVHTDYAGTYCLKVDDYCVTATEARFGCPQTFDPQRPYTLCLFNEPAGMERTGNRINILRLPNGTLTPQPGELRAATAAITPVADDTLRLQLPLKQLTRRLTLRIKLQGGNPDIIARTEARITGVAPAIDISTLKLQGDAATVCPLFELHGDVLLASLNLIGIYPDTRQEFTLVITATDGQQQTVARNMTAPLAAFNQGTEPLELDATLSLDFQSDALPDGDITDWVPGGEDEEGDAV